eukprot:jgi/Chlat1/8921/Chrsp92S08223
MEAAVALCSSARGVALYFSTYSARLMPSACCSSGLSSSSSLPRFSARRQCGIPARLEQLAQQRRTSIKCCASSQRKTNPRPRRAPNSPPQGGFDDDRATRRSRQGNAYEYDDEEEYDEDDDFEYEAAGGAAGGSGSGRRRRPSGYRPAAARGEREKKPGAKSLSMAWVAGAFVLGIGAGISVDSGLNIEPNNVASREVIDRQTPNPEICLANGRSAMVLDQRLFVSFNPFNVYVSQPEVKPGCVLLSSNWSVLEERNLVSKSEVRACKKNMNTFGFVGDLRRAPEVNCVYHSEDAENQFLVDPRKARMGDGVQLPDTEFKAPPLETIS